MSNGDKRTTHTDALETLGLIHFKPEHRDAIHLAVEPVVAGEDLKPGEWINYEEGKAWYASNKNDAHGIVDPFLTKPVKEGDKFWLIIRPRVITSLRHVWEHPDFPKEV